MAKKVQKVREAPRDTIAKVMMVDHGKIVKLLKKFERSIEGTDLKEITDNFKTLRKKLNNHFDVEEHVIFDHLTDPSQGIKDDLGLLLKEHISILEYLDHIWDLLENGDELPEPEDYELFLNMLKNHAQFEDKMFYPRLDKELEMVEKAEIISGIIDSTGYVDITSDSGSL